jgi:prepilin-type N-terminal cleavage/methylation domain-containing protein
VPNRFSTEHRWLGDRGLRLDGGFTLHELLVVVAMIGLILLVALPNLRRSQIRAELLDDVKMVRQALMVARINAIKSSRRVAVMLLPGDTAQPGQSVVAWVDELGDETLNAGDEEVGRWNLGVKALIGRDLTDTEMSLHPMPGGTRGVVFLPNGSAITHATDVGIGFGSVVISDFRDNRIRLVIAAGAGSIQEQMWNPDLGTWSNELRFWRY